MATDYGTDVSAEPDLDPTFTITSGIQVVVARVVRRWQTLRGFCTDDPDCGEDLRLWLNRVWTRKTGYDFKAAAEREALKEEAVYACACGVQYDFTTRKVAMLADITTQEGTFRLTLAISAVTIEVLGIKLL